MTLIRLKVTWIYICILLYLLSFVYPTRNSIKILCPSYEDGSDGTGSVVVLQANNRRVFIVLFSVSIAVGRFSFVTALLRQHVSPLCHKRGVSRPGEQELHSREHAKGRKVRARRTTTRDGGDGGRYGVALVFPSCVTVAHTTHLPSRCVVTRHRVYGPMSNESSRPNVLPIVLEFSIQ